MNIKRFIVPSDGRCKLKDYSPSDTGDYTSRDQAQQALQDDLAELSDLQGKLYAQNKHALLIVLQGIDGAGKDSTIKHVMSGVNPSGCVVESFKAPSEEELDHDYLWRHVKALPERGQIGIFNRSHYEEVIVVRVHPQLLAKERIPDFKNSDKLWSSRYRQINDFERYLVDNGVAVLKFFLNLSKAEQKRRFLERLDKEDKNWKFSAADVAERQQWDAYQEAYEDMLGNTSTEYAPWHVVPADRKWFTRLVVANLIVRKLQSLDLRYPELDKERKKQLEEARRILEQESG